MNALLAVMRLHKKKGSVGMSPSPQKKRGSSLTDLEISSGTPGSSSLAIVPYCDEFSRISQLYAGVSAPVPAPMPLADTPSVAATAAPVASESQSVASPAHASIPEPPAAEKPVTWSALNQDPPLMFRKSGDMVEKGELVAGPEGSLAERSIRVAKHTRRV